MTEDAELSGLGADPFVRGEEAAPRSVVLALSGPGSESFASGWEGVTLWKNGSCGRGARKNWFLEVFRIPDVPAIIPIPESDVRFSTMRAGGPGGQHQNTTDSAVRARWDCPSGKSFVVTSRDERSQHANRKRALRVRASCANHGAHRLAEILTLTRPGG